MPLSPPVEASTLPDPTTHLPTALIVEDEWLVRMEIADAFADAGWTVTESSTGEMALALMGGGQQFDLLITDIRLPGSLTGWDVADAFRAAEPNGAVIYATATPVIETRCVRASAFVGKPCHGEELVRIAARLIPRRET